ICFMCASLTYSTPASRSSRAVASFVFLIRNLPLRRPHSRDSARTVCATDRSIRSTRAKSSAQSGPASSTVTAAAYNLRAFLIPNSLGNFIVFIVAPLQYQTELKYDDLFFRLLRPEIALQRGHHLYSRHPHGCVLYPLSYILNINPMAAEFTVAVGVHAGHDVGNRLLC